MSSTRAFSTAAPVDAERELLVRCQRYEPEALTDLFDRFHDEVFGFLMARTADVSLAEELTRETFIRALELFPKQRNLGAGLGPWLLRVANGRLADRRRPPGRPRPADALPALPEGEGPEAEAARLRAALDLLPVDQQEVLSLRLLAHLPINIVARALHRGPRATRGLQTRGLKMLARLLAPAEDPVMGS